MRKPIRNQIARISIMACTFDVQFAKFPQGLQHPRCALEDANPWQLHNEGSEFEMAGGWRQ